MLNGQIPFRKMQHTGALKKLTASISFFLQVTQYLLDKALIIDEDTLYELSLKIEPRLPA